MGENWMSNLPIHLHSKPLNELAIPGSHESSTFGLDRSCTAPTSPDAQSGIKTVAKLCCCCGIKIIHRWGVTQSLTFTQQLQAGVRYFDLRVSTRPDVPNDLYLVHSLYGPKLNSALEEIASFLGNHPKEVVLIDFNHFYDMNIDNHQKCVDDIFRIFGNKICPFDPELIKLEQMWSNSYQVVVFYHYDNKYDLRQYNQIQSLWDGKNIPSPWLNVDDVTKMIEKLRNNSDKRLHRRGFFYVTQGVLTPGFSIIAKNICSSLEEKCSKPAAAPFVRWLETKQAKEVNICIMDFVEMENFIDTVVALNTTNSSPGHSTRI